MPTVSCAWCTYFKFIGTKDIPEPKGYCDNEKTNGCNPKGSWNQNLRHSETRRYCKSYNINLNMQCGPCVDDSSTCAGDKKLASEGKCPKYINGCFMMV